MEKIQTASHDTRFLLEQELLRQVSRSSLLIQKSTSPVWLWFVTPNSGPTIDGGNVEEGTIGRQVELANGATMVGNITLAGNGVHSC